MTGSWRLIGATVACLALSSAPARAEQKLLLDSAGRDVKTAQPLTAGASYIVRVTGTASIWRIGQWSQPGTFCGVAEAGPMFGSPATARTGPVGWDAETIFAVPPKVDFRGFTCVPAQIPFHSLRQSPGGVAFDTGAGFTHLEPIGGPFEVPRADHTYHYRITGTGALLAVTFGDQPRGDNYGAFDVTVFTEAECAAASCIAGAAAQPPARASSQEPLRPAAGGVLSTSTTKRCASRRVIRIHLRAPRGVKLRSAVVKYRSRTVRLKGRKLRTWVDLRGVPKGRFTVKITITSTRGQVFRTTRRFKTCTPRAVTEG
jgi:hypothetical protein